MTKPELPNNIPQAQPENDAGLQSLRSAVKLIFRLLAAVVVILLLGSLVRLYVTVKQHQIGVVYRFGRVERILRPGDSGFILPPPIDQFEAYTVTREQSLSTDAFFYARSEAEKRTGRTDAAPETLRPGLDGYLVAGDRNLVHCEATLYFQASDPLKFYEMSADGRKLLKSLVDHALVQAAAELGADDMLFDISRFSEASRRHLVSSIDKTGLGVKVNRLVLRTTPPRQVSEAFNRHTTVSQQVDQMIKEAESYGTTRANAADAEAARVMALARADAGGKLAAAESRASRYKALMDEYECNRRLVARELYAQTIQRVLENAEEKYLIDPEDGREIRIQLERSKDSNPPRQNTETDKP